VLSLNKTAIEELNHLGKHSIPFLVVVSFDKTYVDIIQNPCEDISNVKFSIVENRELKYSKNICFDAIKPIDFENYKVKFDYVIDEIKNGNTYLLNLTAPSKIDTKLTLEEIYNITNAKFKLLYKDKFVCFSPERFIKIVEDEVFTYPMKGTINADIPNAKQKILEDKKELAEHIMVVDLLRNDLSTISKNVRVTKFRYIDELSTSKGNLFQVSSEIKGKLTSDWKANIGNILDSLLPAGSISGTPKKKTLEIIEKIENYDRGFFTGIFGYFDGKSFDSGVLIRYIERNGKDLVYKSGGGITLDSDALSEYNELISKVYLS
jgi:para-aminobenzoate synthetase component 1